MTRSLCDEILKISATGIMPDGDHVPASLLMWFDDWAKKIIENPKEHKHVWVEGPEVICNVCGKWK